MCACMKAEIKEESSRKCQDNARMHADFCFNIYMCAYMHVSLDIGVCVFICICVCECVYMCVSVYASTCSHLCLGELLCTTER